MKKTLAALTGILGLALLYTVFQFFPVSEFLALLKQIPLSLVAAYLGVSAAIYCLLVIRWKIICRQHRVSAPFHRLLAYRYVGFAVSFITPGPRVGGEPVRASLMKRDGIEMPQAMSTVIADKTSELLSFGAMFVLALAAATILTPLPSGMKTSLIAVAAIMLGLVSFGLINILRGKDPILKLYKLFRLNKIKWLKKYKRQLQEFEDNIHGFYGDKPAYFWGAFAVSSVAWSMSLIEFYLILKMLGISPTIFDVFLVYSVVGAIYLLPIPFALGSLEAGQATLFAALGFPAAAGAVSAMITRSRDLLWTFIGLSLLGLYSVEKKQPNEPLPRSALRHQE